ncbi:phosphoribosyl-AMP cyclohydrolase [Aquibaculum sediminis]|uniref:phosphoribosyl-AMP cyclohydrolase n=1 Tax=Aquibaculum sediminis TaxID=3231907 RepID=UPI003453DB16
MGKKMQWQVERPESIESVVAALRFDERGLIPAIAQQHDSKEVLMLAWMSADSLRETLHSGRVCYWSRSRAALWRKGESSGHVQQLVDLRWDCDADCLLLLVEQTGPACHTNRRSCFYNALRDGEPTLIAEPQSNA